MPDFRRYAREKLRTLGLAGADEAGIADEIADELQDRYERMLTSGTEPSEAWQSVTEQIDWRSLTQDLQRTVASGAEPEPARKYPLADLVNEIRHAFRRMRRAPGFSAVVLLTLAVGIGVNTALFTVIDSVLLEPLPYPRSDRLVSLWHTAAGLSVPQVGASPGTTFLYRDHGRAFEDIGMWNTGAVSITGGIEPERVRAIFTTDGTLPVLGVPPQIGRLFTRNDDSPGASGAVILTHAYWQRRFGGDAGVLGHRMMVDGKSREVVGVMPQEFRFADPAAALILPFQIDRAGVVFGNFSYQAVARLRPGVTLEQANADVGRMLAMVQDKIPLPPGINKKMIEEARLGPDVRPLVSDVIGNIGKVLWILMGTVGMLLLIACANASNLMLVRAEGRRREFAIRFALGASWRNIATAVIAESSLLGLIGGILGLVVAQAMIALLVWMGPTTLPRLDEIALDATSVIFTLAVSVAAGLLFGIIPSLRHATPPIAAALDSTGRGASGSRERHRARNTLVVAQVGIAMVLLIGAGLMLRTLSSMLKVHPGFTDPEQVLTFRISIPEAEVSDNERVYRVVHEMLERIRAMPGVTAAGGINSITMDGEQSSDPIFVEDRTYAQGEIPAIRTFKHVTPGVFEALGNPLIAGRRLGWSDLFNKRPVVLVSENFAREVWGSAGAALGKRIRTMPAAIWFQIVGVMGNERDDGVDRAAPTIVYFPALRPSDSGTRVLARRTIALAVRSERASTAAFAREVQHAVWSVNRSLPLADVRTVNDIYRRSMARTSFTLVMLSLASAMALLLGLIGIYGVIAYMVSQSTREIGIRLALGAEHGAVRRLFIRKGFMLAACGIGAGLIAAAPLARVMEALLYGVEPMDPVTFICVPIGLLAFATLVAWASTRRATRIQPTEALRGE